MNTQTNDYLKYWRVIRYYIRAKHGLSQVEIETLLFLYSETYFSRDKFQEFNELLSWDRNRFNKLLREGWIEIFRRRMNRKKMLYQLSFKSIRMIEDIYRKLNGEEIPVSLSQNPLFKKNVSYSDKVYRNMIKSMHEFTKQQRHLSPE
jgi:hypothetical protein